MTILSLINYEISFRTYDDVGFRENRMATWFVPLIVLK